MKNQILWSEVTVQVKNLIPAGYNPRKISEKEKEDLKESLSKFGRAEAVVLNTGSRANNIIGGHRRIEIYADLGVEEIEAKIPSRELSEVEEKELNLRLNKNTGSWDEELLKNLDLDLLLGVGFGDKELQKIFDDVDVLEDDFSLEKAIKETVTPRVKLGEIWQLGENRLLVGDSTDEFKVKELMQNDLADIVYCDPPYNIGLDYSKGVGDSQKYGGSYSGKDDSKKEKDYALFMQNSIATALKFAKPNSHFFYWCDCTNIGLIQGLYKEAKIKCKRVCMWIKNNQLKFYENKRHRLQLAD